MPIALIVTLLMGALMLLGVVVFFWSLYGAVGGISFRLPRQRYLRGASARIAYVLSALLGLFVAYGMIFMREHLQNYLQY